MKDIWEEMVGCARSGDYFEVFFWALAAVCIVGPLSVLVGGPGWIVAKIVLLIEGDEE